MKPAKEKRRRARGAKCGVVAECQTCGGSGYVDLRDKAPELAVTAELIETSAPPSGGRWWTAADVAKRLDIGHGAACNRLRRLERLGLAEGVRLGTRLRGYVRKNWV